MNGPARRRAMGWLPDYPDFRDYSADHDRVSPVLKSLGQTKSIKSMLLKTGVSCRGNTGLPKSVDLRPWCPPV